MQNVGQKSKKLSDMIRKSFEIKTVYNFTAMLSLKEPSTEVQQFILNSLEDTGQLWKRAAEITEGLAAVVLQGHTKKTRTFQLGEVKTEHITPSVCKECISY